MGEDAVRVVCTSKANSVLVGIGFIFFLIPIAFFVCVCSPRDQKGNQENRGKRAGLARR